LSCGTFMVGMLPAFDGWLCWGVTVLDMGVPPGKKKALGQALIPNNRVIASHCRDARKQFLRKNR
jgi:hypothetical protein